MKKRIKVLLKYLRLILLGQEAISTRNRIKFAFEEFFSVTGQGECELFYLGITKLDIIIKKKLIIVRVTLQRPGMFIGRRGQQIDLFNQYLNRIARKNVILSIDESTLWNRETHPTIYNWKRLLKEGF